VQAESCLFLLQISLQQQDRPIIFLARSSGAHLSSPRFTTKSGRSLRCARSYLQSHRRTDDRVAEKASDALRE
jgi:hypothetical protein